MTDKAYHFRNMQVHPKTCPGCERVWEFESADRCKCVYCGYKYRIETKVHEGETPLYKMFIPLLLWVIAGIIALHLMGRIF